MKKALLMVISMMLSITMIGNTALAGENLFKDKTSVKMKSNLLDKNIKKDKVSETAEQRGDFFIRADLAISDEGNGSIGAVAIGYLAVDVDEAYISVYLDQYDEKEDFWYQVEYYDAEFYAEDYPNGLSTPTVNITFQKVPKGHYYRLRGAFSAVKDSQFEGFSPVTDGIWIE